MDKIAHESKHDLLEYLFTHTDQLQNLLYHIYNKSVASSITKLLLTEFEEELPEEFPIEKRELLKMIILKLDPSNTEESIANSCEILCEIIASKRYIDFLLSKEVIGEIFKIGLSGNSASLMSCLRYLINAMYLNINETNNTIENNVNLECVIEESIIHMQSLINYIKDRTKVRSEDRREGKE